MAKKIKEKPAGDIIKSEYPEHSAVLTEYVRTLSGNENLRVEYRDLNDQNMKAMVRQNKIILRKTDNLLYDISTLQAAAASHAALWATSEPVPFSRHGFDIWNKAMMDKVQVVYNRAWHEESKAMLDSAGYKEWLIKASGFEHAVDTDGKKIKDADGNPVYIEKKRKKHSSLPDFDEIVSMSENMEKIIEKEVRANIEDVRLKMIEEASGNKKLQKKLIDNNLPEMTYISSDSYIATHISLDEKQKEHIRKELDRWHNNTSAKTDCIQRISEINETSEKNKFFSLINAGKEITQNSLHPGSEDDDDRFLMNTLVDVAIAGTDKNDVFAVSLLRKRAEIAEKEGRMKEYIQNLIETVCDRDAESKLKPAKEKTKQEKSGKKEKDEHATLILQPRKKGEGILILKV